MEATKLVSINQSYPVGVSKQYSIVVAEVVEHALAAVDFESVEPAMVVEVVVPVVLIEVVIPAEFAVVAVGIAVVVGTVVVDTPAAIVVVDTPVALTAVADLVVDKMVVPVDGLVAAVVVVVVENSAVQKSYLDTCLQSHVQLPLHK